MDPFVASHVLKMVSCNTAPASLLVLDDIEVSEEEEKLELKSPLSLMIKLFEVHLH